MGLLDLFKKKPDPLLEWLERHYGGRAQGREMRVVAGYLVSQGPRLAIFLKTEAEPEYLQMQRPETYLSAEDAKRLPSIADPDWPMRMEDAQGLQLGGGFVLDPDFDLESALVRARGGELAGYLERFSRTVDQINYEPPWLRLCVEHGKTTQAGLARDIERAHELLAFLERPL